MLRFKNGREKFRKKESTDTVSIVITGDVCPWHDAVEAIKKR